MYACVKKLMKTIPGVPRPDVYVLEKIVFKFSVAVLL